MCVVQIGSHDCIVKGENCKSHVRQNTAAGFDVVQVSAIDRDRAEDAPTSPPGVSRYSSPPTSPPGVSRYSSPPTSPLEYHDTPRRPRPPWSFTIVLAAHCGRRSGPAPPKALAPSELDRREGLFGQVRGELSSGTRRYLRWCFDKLMQGQNHGLLILLSSGMPSSAVAASSPTKLGRKIFRNVREKSSLRFGRNLSCIM